MISEPDPTEAAEAPEGALAKAGVYMPQNEILKIQLGTYQNDNKLTKAQLAKELGFGLTQVTKYLNGKADWNVTKFEAAVRDVLRTASTRALLKARLFPTSVTAQVRGVCETIRRTDDFGLLHSPAGWGKSSGIELYTVEFPLAGAFELTNWLRRPIDMIRLLWMRYGSGRIEHGRTRMDVLVQMFKGTHRPFIIDNAHKLTRGGLAFWFDFHDVTGCPIIFSGNPEVVKLIQQNDQMFSRLGLIEMVELQEDEYLSVARQLILQILQEPVKDLDDPAVDVIARPGHLRTLRKQLMLTKVIREAKGRDWETCFKAAATKLVKDERLLIHD